MHELVLVAAPALVGTWATAWAWLRWRLRRPRGEPGIGERAPDLPDLQGADGQTHTWTEFARYRLLVLLFVSSRCPGVKAYHGRILRLHERLKPEGVGFVAVNPIDEGLYPSESLAQMEAEPRFPFAYVKDADQRVMRAYGAICTPQVFVLDERRRLRYRGRIDDAMVESRVRRRHLEDALERLLAGRDVAVAETAPLGCSIERKPSLEGTTPDATPRVPGAVRAAAARQ